METLSSERLTLRPLQADDLPFFIQLHADPGVARTLGDGKPRTEEATRAWYALVTRSYEEHGVGQLAVCRRDDGRLLGRCGLTIYEIERDLEPPAAAAARPLRCFWGAGSAGALPHTRELELGYVIARASWRQGYAAEAARAVRDHGLGTLAAPRLISVIIAGNVASEGVARRIAMTRRERAYVLGERPVGVYEVDRARAEAGR